MPTFELTDDELNTLREIFDGVGNDCPSVDWDKFTALGVKLGFWESEKPPTEEELKRREEFANSQFGKQMQELFARNNQYLEEVERIMKEDMLFSDHSQWPIGSKIAIRLPNDYNIKDKS